MFGDKSGEIVLKGLKVKTVTLFKVIATLLITTKHTCLISK